MNAQQHERYSRQVSLPGFGAAGQQKLLNARVLIIGAGGLGCPVLQYLAAAGVGTIGIADDDVVSLSNLHRQLLYSTNDIGKPKAATAAQRLQQLNPDLQFEVFDQRVTTANAWYLINSFDMVVDGSDNFATRYLVNDACVLLKKPLVYGSIFRFEGQVAVFNVQGSVNYRDVFAEPPEEGEVPDCSEAGVLGVLPGIIGSLMANETLKLITGMGEVLSNSLLTYNALLNSFYTIGLRAGEQSTHLPANRTEFESKVYDNSCLSTPDITALTAAEFDDLLRTHKAKVVDVREPGEEPVITSFEHMNYPLSELKKEPIFLEHDNVVLFCQTGKRSLQAAVLIKNQHPHSNVYSLKKGIADWYEQQQKQTIHE